MAWVASYWPLQKGSRPWTMTVGHTRIHSRSPAPQTHSLWHVRSAPCLQRTPTPEKKAGQEPPMCTSRGSQHTGCHPARTAPSSRSHQSPAASGHPREHHWTQCTEDGMLPGQQEGARGRLLRLRDPPPQEVQGKSRTSERESQGAASRPHRSRCGTRPASSHCRWHPRTLGSTQQERLNGPVMSSSGEEAASLTSGVTLPRDPVSTERVDGRSPVLQEGRAISSRDTLHVRTSPARLLGPGSSTLTMGRS